jgi:uncharacterized protein YggE
MAQDPFVEVTGHGAGFTTPDRLRAHLAAEARAVTVAQAFAEADRALQAMLAALREHGVADEDLRSTGIEVYSDRDRGEAPGRFYASMSVEAMLRGIAAAGTALSAAVEAGGDAGRVHGMSLEATTTQQALAAARDAAWADATGKAEQYAALAGRSLGAVVSVSELDGRDGPVPLARAAAASGASGVSLEPGTRSVHAAIAVRWGLE